MDGDEINLADGRQHSVSKTAAQTEGRQTAGRLEGSASINLHRLRRKKRLQKLMVLLLEYANQVR